MKDKIIEFLYKTIKVPYSFLFKNSEPWGVTVTSLLSYRTESLGNDLGQFLRTNNYQVQESLEEHDVYHILTRIGTTVKEEVDMQFYLLGNGKRSPFAFIVIATGLLFYLNHFKSFYNCYKKGKKAHQFFDIDFYKLLQQPTATIRETFNIK